MSAPAITPQGRYDQVTRDLANKAADDACAAIMRTVALHDDIAGKAMIAIMASGQTFAISAALLAHKLGGDAESNPEAVIDALWSQVRPITLDAMRANLPPAPGEAA